MKKEEKISVVQLSDEMLSEVTGGTGDGGSNVYKVGYIITPNGNCLTSDCSSKNGIKEFSVTITAVDNNGRPTQAKCNSCGYTYSGIELIKLLGK